MSGRNDQYANDMPTDAISAITKLADVAAHADVNSLKRQGYSVNPDGTVNVLGFLPVEPEIAAIANYGHALGGAFLAGPLRNKLHGVVLRTADWLGNKEVGQRIGLGDHTLHGKLAMGVSLAALATASFGPTVGSLVTASKNYNEEYAAFLKKAAPYLDKISGKHTPASLKEPVVVSNEVIKNHLGRLSGQRSVERSKALLDAIPGAGIFLSGILHPNSNHSPEARAAAAEKVESLSSIIGVEPHTAVKLGTVALPKVASSMKASMERRHDAKNSQCDAFEMIHTLYEQVNRNPNARSFELPGKSRQTLGLEEYISAVFSQHEVDSGFEQLGKHHHQRMQDNCKAIADAIRSGDLIGMDLVQLVGERKIVGAHGKTIASEKEVCAEIERLSGAAAVAETTAQQWFAKAKTTAAKLKEFVEGAKGKERSLIIGSLPTEVRETIGISPEEGKKIVKETRRELPEIQRTLLEKIVGMNDEKAAALGVNAETRTKYETVLDSHEKSPTEFRAAIAEIAPELVDMMVASAEQQFSRQKTTEHGKSKLEHAKHSEIDLERALPDSGVHASSIENSGLLAEVAALSKQGKHGSHADRVQGGHGYDGRTRH